MVIHRRFVRSLFFEQIFFQPFVRVLLSPFGRTLFIVMIIMIIGRYGALQQIDQLLVPSIVFLDIRRQFTIDNVFVQLILQARQIRPFVLADWRLFWFVAIHIALVFVVFQCMIVAGTATAVIEIDVRRNVRLAIVDNLMGAAAQFRPMMVLMMLIIRFHRSMHHHSTMMMGFVILTVFSMRQFA